MVWKMTRVFSNEGQMPSDYLQMFCNYQKNNEIWSSQSWQLSILQTSTPRISQGACWPKNSGRWHRCSLKLLKLRNTELDWVAKRVVKGPESKTERKKKRKSEKTVSHRRGSSWQFKKKKNFSVPPNWYKNPLFEAASILPHFVKLRKCTSSKKPSLQHLLTVLVFNWFF